MKTESKVVRRFWAVAVQACALLLCFAAKPFAQTLSAEVWAGDFDETNGYQWLHGRAVAEDDWGYEFMTVYNQLKPPSGTPYLDSSAGGGVYYADATTANTIDVGEGNFQTGNYVSDAQMWYGSNFHGCADSWLWINIVFWFVQKTGGCYGAPGMNWYDNRCPSLSCTYSGCMLFGSTYRYCHSALFTTFFSWCSPPACKYGGDQPGECLVV